MTLIDAKIDAAVENLIREWNTAERQIKMAEQIRRAEIVAASIFELRYAGRKVIDVLDLVLHEDRTKSEVSEKIYALIVDATEDCLRANFDAVDAAIDYITLWLYDNERNFGIKNLIRYFPRYAEITGQIADIQEKIAEAREHRAKRQQIYEDIVSKKWADIVSLFDQMRISDARILVAAERDKRRMLLISVAFALVGFIVGLAGTVVALMH